MKLRDILHQLINIVDYCHNKGVSHRDLKDNGLLHTTYGTSNYIALEVLSLFSPILVLCNQGILLVLLFVRAMTG
ncbi:hypothetical protein NC651_032666 [Populus alba x Populus x berolinensis]|nr:hypothetical protein NC651_032666 [Populus alba x Populus x berolinensis]